MVKIGPVPFYVTAAPTENMWIPNVEYLHVTLFPKLQRKYLAWARNFQTYPVCTEGWTIFLLLFSLLYAEQHPLVRYRWRPALNWSAENATDQVQVQVQTTVILIQRFVKTIEGHYTVEYVGIFFTANYVKENPL